MRPITQTISALGLTAAMLLAAPPAGAQQLCVTHEAVVVQLEKEYDEKAVGRGIANAGKAMLELFVSEEGTWTVVVSDPTGRSCFMASGESWQPLEPQPPQPGNPA